MSDRLMIRRDSPGPSQTPEIEELTGIGNEVIITLVFARMKWDIHSLCCMASVSRRLHALAVRILWREVCINRAPKMTPSLTADADGPSNRIVGGWQALAKLLFYCGGCQPSTHFELGCRLPGHFVTSARFSKTSGRSFVSPSCRGDELYMSNVCEHRNPAGPGGMNLDVGMYRGVYRSFASSRTRESLTRRNIGFVAEVKCPFCRGRVWSMTVAGLVPWRSAARWLTTRNGRLEYFVCFNGHLHGACWLFRLEISDEANTDEDNFMDSGDDDMEMMIWR